MKIQLEELIVALTAKDLSSSTGLKIDETESKQGNRTIRTFIVSNGTTTATVEVKSFSEPVTGFISDSFKLWNEESETWKDVDGTYQLEF